MSKNIYLQSCAVMTALAISACSVESGESSEGEKIEVAVEEVAAVEQDESDVLPDSDGEELDLTNAAEIFSDVPYDTVSEKQSVNVFVPAGDGPFPAIFAIHGGGFMFGDKVGGGNNTIIEAGLRRGYVVVAVGYRLSGEAQFPAAADDVLSAISFIRENAEAYRVDPNRFVSWGGSAGGNLSALAGTKGDRELGTNVQVAIDWFGPILFDQVDSQFDVLGIEPKLGATSSVSSPESKYLGQTVGSPEAASLILAASPQTYISADDAAFFIQHGSADANVPVLQSQYFFDALLPILGEDKVRFEILDGAGHGGAEFESETNIDAIFDFVESHFE